MSMLQGWFSAHTEEVWKQLSEQIGGKFIDGGFWHTDRVTAKVDSWTVTLDTHSEQVGRSCITYTRLRAAYVNRDGFRFTLYTADLFSGLAARLGMQDVVVGDPEFDRIFVVQGNDEEKVRALFSDAGLRERLRVQPEILLAVKDDEGWFGEHFPAGVDELLCRVTGRVDSLERLRGLFDLFAQTLHGLCRLGSAEEANPPSGPVL